MVNPAPSRLAFTGWNCLWAVIGLDRRLVELNVLCITLGPWLTDKAKPLGELLCSAGKLTPERRQALDLLTKDHLKAHGNDMRKGLAALTLPASVHAQLQRFQDPEWRTCLESVRARPEPPTVPTAPANGTPEPPPLPLADPTPPASVSSEPRYKILSSHAQGSLGEVFLAEDRELGREVALKEIQAAFAHDETARRRFLLEAEVTGRLEHPGIVPVYGMGRHPDGRPYYAMRFVKGETLKDAIDRFHAEDANRLDPAERRLALRELLTRFVAVCNVVAYAHSRGVLHRDLKPQNVMLGQYGETLVVDWGLAKLFERDATARATGEASLAVRAPDLTIAGRAVGSPAYMSPEQASGYGDCLSPASDVYSLGATLYYLLTGRPPFGREAPNLYQVLRDLAEGKFPPPSRVKKDVPPALEAVCLKAMAVDPDHRYPSALNLAAAVERWLADGSMDTPLRTPPPARLPWRAAIVLLLLAGLGAGAYFGFGAWQREQACRELRERIAVALAHAQRGSLEEGLTKLREAAATAREIHAPADLTDKLNRDLEQLERYRQFQRLADSVWLVTRGSHDGPGEPAPGARCEKALAVYKAHEETNWAAALTDGPLGPEQVREVKTRVPHLLALRVLHLLVADGKDAPTRDVVQRALKRLEEEACGGREDSHASWALRALYHERAGELELADRAKKQKLLVPARTPQDFALSGLAAFLVEGADGAAVTDRFRQALRLDPTHFDAHFGLVLCSRDEPTRLEHLTACITLLPRSPVLRYLRGLTYSALKKTDLAYLDFDAAVQADPGFALGHLARGRIHVELNHPAEAERDFSRALEIDPNLGVARAWRGLVRARGNRHADAVADAEEAVRRDARDRLSLFHAARVYAQAARAVLAVGKGAVDEQQAHNYTTRCLDLLNQAVAQGLTRADLRGDPDLDFEAVRDDPRFRPLLGKLGKE
ncbi:MAG: protein kinase [Gemmataceae bacterium]|nr:protein kinase [Gemmataceae bacterium]